MNKVKDNQENLQKCICKNCPSYNECMKKNGENLFCAKGKTNCRFEKKGCLCKNCPVAKENGLSDSYYCESKEDLDKKKPKKKRTKCEVFSRICGYFRPIVNWNEGKQAEWDQRKVFDVC